MMQYGTPEGFRMYYKISRGCYRVLEWRGGQWMPVARDLTFTEAKELCK